MKKQIQLTTLLLSVALWNPLQAQQWGNYTLYSTQNSTTAKLIDTTGAVYHTWTFPTNKKTGYSTYLLPGGDLLRAVAKGNNSFTGGPICGEVQRLDWGSNVVWDYVYSTTNYCTHHDVGIMPNGNVLLIAYERRTAAEVVAAGCSSSLEMWPDKIVEVQPTGPTTGIVVWEWKAWDHLVQNVDPTKANYQTSILDHPELLDINYNTQKDWMHMNGVDYNPMLDQITFSCHNLDEIYVIDHSTTTAEAASHTGGNSGKGGDILYRWGNPAAYGAPGASILNVVHDAHWIPEGNPNAGYLVGFNNHGISQAQSSVDQIAPPVNGYNYTYTPGQAYTPTSYTLRHGCNGHGTNMGNSQQLPNGNMLVCVATIGSVYEVDPAGTTLWTLSTGGSNAQAFRYDDCYINNVAPAIPTITQVANILTASAGTTYQWYMNGVLLPGETNATYSPTANGMYSVRITNSTSCEFSYSAGFNYQLTGLNYTDKQNSYTIYPNPTTGLIMLDKEGLSGNTYSVVVFDSYGKLIIRQSNNPNINLEQFSNGIYTVSIQLDNEVTINKKIILIR